MLKNLAQALHYINHSTMSTTNLASNSPDQAWLNGQNESTASHFVGNKPHHDMESKMNKQHVQIYYANISGMPYQFYSQLKQRNLHNFEQLTHMSSPISWEDMHRKLGRKQNRINIPSVLKNIHIYKKCESFNSEIPEFGTGKNEERFLAYKNDSQNTKSTTTSIRDRTKEINWPKNFRPPESGIFHPRY